MNSPSQQDTQPPENYQQQTNPTIRKVPSGDLLFNANIRGCSVCGVKHNELRDFCKIIVITIDGQHDTYCDTCLAQQLQKQCLEAKILQEKFIYQKQFETSMSENDKKAFLSFERDPNADQLRKELEQLEAQEYELDRALYTFKQESRDLQIKVHGLEQKQEKFWMDLNKFQKRAIKLEQKAFLAKNQRELQKQSLEELSKTSIVHKFFQIEIEDSYVQVCGLTLGKKPDQIEVNWEDTNTALGHLLLAYNYLSLKYGIPYTRFSDMKIQGHLSEVKTRTSDNFYPIAYTKQNQKVFGIVLQNLLGELAELTQHIQEIENIQYTEELKLPFQIFKKEGKIVDLFVSPSKIDDKNKWSQWTKAMRYFLIDIKHILTISLLSDPYI